MVGDELAGQDPDDLPVEGEVVESQQVPQQLQAFIAAASFAGPLPIPQHLAEYDQIVPGAASKIIDMAVDQAEHRRGLEKTVIAGADKRATHGLYIGGAVAALVVILGFILIMTGHSGYGLAAIIGQAAVLAGVFVFTKIDQRKERQEKAKLAPPSPQLTLPFDQG